METSTTLLITAHAEFLESALAELKRVERQLRIEEILAPGLALCSVPDGRSFTRHMVEARPIFVRHIAPVQTIIPLKNTEKDLERL
ncbi:MAG TPA: hypothetical protein VFN35_20970, partial [Ktedonobacteraceae bacterium]|nr:hypothetical protein [Ktedonobacteraceae bacterium]